MSWVIVETVGMWCLCALMIALALVGVGFIIFGAIDAFCDELRRK